MATIAEPGKEMNEEKVSSLKKLLEAGRMLQQAGNHHHPFNEKLDWIDTLIQTEELERRRFAEYLNDELGSMLSGIKLKFSAFEKDTSSLSPESKESFSSGVSLLDEAIEQIRNLAHHEMPMNMDFGLTNAINNLVNRINDSALLAIKIHIINSEISLPIALETTAYRILQELLKNIMYHSKAVNSSIFIYQHGSKLLIEISDDGIGFNYQKELHNPRGLGLKKIFQRVQMLGGKIDVLSTQKVGTKFSIELPLK